MGHTPTLMDDSRFNYVAQPEDKIDPVAASLDPRAMRTRTPPAAEGRGGRGGAR